MCVRIASNVDGFTTFDAIQLRIVFTKFIYQLMYENTSKYYVLQQYQKEKLAKESIQPYFRTVYFRVNGSL